MIYAGVEVLTMRPHRGGPISETIRRPTAVLTSAGGVATLAPRVTAGAGATPYVFEALSRSEVADLRSFYDRQGGSRTPWWIPSYQADLSLAANASGGATALTVVDNGYSSKLWPSTGARRHLALYTPALTLALVKVTAASGGNLTIEPALPAPHTMERSVVSFLRLVRFEGSLELVWHNCWLATATITVVELPQEAPL